MTNKKHSALICLLIGLCFFWSGSGYLTWMYHLLDFYSASSVDVLTEVVGYLFQILGLVLSSYYVWKKQGQLPTAHVFAALIAADFVFLLLSVLSPTGITCLIFGFLMNLLHGFVASIYLTKLVTEVSGQYRGITFGCGYGIGCIGSFLLSLIGNGNFLKNRAVLFVYFVLILLSVLLLYLPLEKPVAESAPAAPQNPLTKQLLLLAGIFLLLLCSTKGMGFYFPSADLSNTSVSLEYSRIFYAVGLVLAGILNDKSRKFGAVCCLSSLVCPFIMLVLKGNIESSLVLWIISYLFFGFFSVYRIILFTDMAANATEYLYLAGRGLMWGRCGDVLGTILGICFGTNIVILVFVTSVFFIITVPLFLSLYHKLYLPVISEKKDKETLLEDFKERYLLSPRESEVFQLIMDGRSNTEIAEALFISENTVKFHMKNILKKTNCSNRTSLIALFEKH